MIGVGFVYFIDPVKLKSLGRVHSHPLKPLLVLLIEITQNLVLRQGYIEMCFLEISHHSI